MWSALGGIGLGAGLGAGLMYLLDPDRGSRRRAIARDKITSAVNRTGQAIGEKSRDLRNRARGIAAETGSLLRSSQAAEKADVQSSQVAEKSVV